MAHELIIAGGGGRIDIVLLLVCEERCLQVQVPLLRTITGVAFDVGVPGNVLGYERVDVIQSFGTYEKHLIGNPQFILYKFGDW